MAARRNPRAAARERFLAELDRDGIRPLPSQANFVLVHVGVDDSARELTEELLERGVVMRPGGEFGLPAYVRITIAPEPLMERVAALLVDSLASHDG